MVEPAFGNAINKIVQENEIGNQLLLALLEEACVAAIRLCSRPGRGAINHYPLRAAVAHKILPRQGKDEQQMRVTLAGCREV